MEKLPIYIDVDGNERQRNEWDVHHPISQSSAHGRGEKDFINLFRLPMFKEYHNLGKYALHPNLPNCPMPSKDLRYLMREAFYEVIDDNVYDRFLFVSEQVQALGKYSINPGIARSARQIGKSWRNQSNYILSGQVRTR